MKILVNGTSVNLGSTAWPTHLQKKFYCEIYNISRAWAGNNYIHDSTISEISERSYDLVIIHWSAHIKIDFRTKYDVAPIDDHTHSNPMYHMMQKNWILGNQPIHDVEIKEKVDHFRKHYREVAQDKKVSIPSTLYNIISLQSILKTQNIPYIFASYHDWRNIFHRYENLYNMIDWNNVFDQYLIPIAQDNNWWDPTDGDYGHPTEEAHRYYANLLYEYINTKNLIKSSKSYQ